MPPRIPHINEVSPDNLNPSPLILLPETLDVHAATLLGASIVLHDQAPGGDVQPYFPDFVDQAAAALFKRHFHASHQELVIEYLLSAIACESPRRYKDLMSNPKDDEPTLSHVIELTRDSLSRRPSDTRDDYRGAFVILSHLHYNLSRAETYVGDTEQPDGASFRRLSIASDLFLQPASFTDLYVYTEACQPTVTAPGTARIRHDIAARTALGFATGVRHAWRPGDNRTMSKQQTEDVIVRAIAWAAAHASP